MSNYLPLIYKISWTICVEIGGLLSVPGSIKSLIYSSWKEIERRKVDNL